ncbi:MAG: DUF3592 domain-containing protein [Aquificae bacterium]|nr:DUF3592 domain-containing protein [Aquificota bacterium]
MEKNKLLFLPFGFWLVVSGTITLFLFYRLVSVFFWKKTEGTVIKSGMERAENNHRYDYFKPAVEYRYTVGGKEYTGRKVFLTELASDRKTVEKVLKQFPEGGKITVYYNPFRPEEAVLKRGYHAGMFIQTLVFFGMLSVFLFTLIFEILYYGADLSGIAQTVKQWLHKIFYGD